MATPSLYRRYRPRRFAELKGQDHVVRALRDAVAGGREGQAYLFSGPRGTGKTSSARILAKVLNCEHPADGEPCCECAACVAVERGTSYDVHELDAASNNGVDAMRDLIEKASLGTPGRHKVYILDEVHMLSKAAEAALLKTLEEPPPHVVFVLATTDPQKVSETIRSRTQHLRFHLLGADTLAEHVRWVAGDAGLDIDEAGLDAAIDQGGGSVRDALSALELIANAGGDAGDELSFDELLEAMIDHDPGRALTAMAAAVAEGHDPRTIAEGLVRHLRNGFLTLLAPELVQRAHHQVDALTAQARRLGPAALVRGIECLGEILVELRHAPDPRVLVEVALVQLTVAPGADADDIGALAARVTKLEQALAAGAAPPPPPVDPATGRATLGGRARPAATGTTASTSASTSTSTPAPATTPAAAPATAPASSDAPAAGASRTAHDVGAQWRERVRPGLKGIVRALFTPVDVVPAPGDPGTPTGPTVVTLAAPNSTHRDKCEQHRAAVERAWAALAGEAVRIELVVGGDDGPSDVAPYDRTGRDDRDERTDGGDRTDPTGRTERAAAASGPPEAEHEAIDLDDLVDAAPGSTPSTLDRLAQAFPGAELIDGRD